MPEGEFAYDRCNTCRFVEIGELTVQELLLEEQRAEARRACAAVFIGHGKLMAQLVRIAAERARGNGSEKVQKEVNRRRDAHYRQAHADLNFIGCNKPRAEVDATMGAATAFYASPGE